MDFAINTTKPMLGLGMQNRKILDRVPEVNEVQDLLARIYELTGQLEQSVGFFMLNDLALP
jgi:hypothetical protein